ncbi:MAG TPA: MipA/OmpV family protein [Burkholderiaceae bacterium]|nr:MipA/OmpV family protein [Burkholderiaceae bacterium]
MFITALLAVAWPQARADRPLWEAGVGVGVLRLPDYRGSDQSRTWVLPVPYIVYRGDILKADREGARAVLLDRERVDFDVSLAATAPTRSDGNAARQGMPDLAATVEVGPNLNATLAHGSWWKLQLRAPLRAALTIESQPRMVGWLASPNLNLDTKIDGWNASLLGGPLFGSRAFNGTYFDVAPQFATPARASYRAPGGFGGWRLIGSTSRRLGSWWLGGFVTADTVKGAVYDGSPLVRRHGTLAFGFALSRVFATSGERVGDDD